MSPARARTSDGLILSNQPLNDGIYSISLDLPPDWGPPLPGQFVQVECPPQGCFGLCRPFSLAGFGRGAESVQVEIVYGIAGRRSLALSECPAGGHLRVTGPLGRPFAPLPGRAPLLVGGGRGIAPLRFAAGAWKQAHPDGRMIYGVRRGDQRIPLPAPPYPLTLAAEDGAIGFAGTVLDLLQHLWKGGSITGQETALYACGPNAMLRALSAWARPKGIPCQVSLETRFGCGFGICAGCAVPRLLPLGEKDPFGRYALACVDGPVMDADEIDWEALRE